MTALVAEREPSVKDHLISLLNALEYGLYPPDGCRACIAAQAPRCAEHEQGLADMEAASKAVSRVQHADGDFAARREFMTVIAELAGLSRVGVFSSVIRSRSLVSSGTVAGGGE